MANFREYNAKIRQMARERAQAQLLEIQRLARAEQPDWEAIIRRYHELTGELPPDEDPLVFFQIRLAICEARLEMLDLATAIEDLTRLLQESVAFQAPKRSGMYRPKMRYAHQGGMNPPVIVVHGNSLEGVTDAYKRFLEGRFRQVFDLIGTPLRIELKTTHNPYADKA